MPHKLCLGALLLSLAFNGNADQSDFNKEIVIVAKKQSTDLKNKIASYIEDVKITQGSLTIEADMVQVHNEPKSNLKSYLAKGKPARFSQRLDDGQLIELQAEEISYSPESNIITIKGNASVSQEGSKVTGDIITYNILTEQLSAESTGSVTTVLKPETNNKAKVKAKAVEKSESVQQQIDPEAIDAATKNAEQLLEKEQKDSSKEPAKNAEQQTSESLQNSEEQQPETEQKQE